MNKINFKKRLAAYVRQRMRGRVLYTKQSREPLYVSTVVSFVKDGIVRKADIAIFRKVDREDIPLVFFYVASSENYESVKKNASSFVNAYKDRLTEAFVFDCERMACSLFKSTNQRLYSEVLGVEVASMLNVLLTVDICPFDAIGNMDSDDAYIGMSGTRYIDHDTALEKLKLFLHIHNSELRSVIKSDYFVAGPNNGLLAGSNGRKPDIVVTKAVDEKHEDYIPYIIIEIDHSKRMNLMFKRMAEYQQTYAPSEIDKSDSNKRVLEYYVFNYETHEWYSFGPNADPEHPSYSKMLDADLDDAFYYDILDYIKTSLPPVQKPTKEPVVKKKSKIKKQKK